MKTQRWSCLPLLLVLLVAPSMQQLRDQLDLVFVIDGSDSVGATNFEVLKKSILDYVLPQMNGQLYVGLIHYSTRRNDEVSMTADPQEFERQVNAVQYVGGETNTNVGIQWGLSTLMTSSAQPGAAKELIVVVDGVSRFPSDTQSVAEFTRGMGVKIWAIGVGQDVTQEELTSIAGDASTVLRTASFSALPAVDLQLAREEPLCHPKTYHPFTRHPETNHPKDHPNHHHHHPETYHTPDPAPPHHPSTHPATHHPARDGRPGGLCEEAVLVSGVGYRAHPTEANKYIQCYFPSETRTLAIVRECPFGLLWNDKQRLCDNYLRVHLAKDPCENGEVGSHPHEGNCRTFYNCEGGRSVPRCCPPGYLYDALSKGCSPCPACTEPCPALCSDIQFACTKYPVFDDFTVYRKWTRDGDVIVPCRNGTLFDISACECVDFKLPYVCPPNLDVSFARGSSGGRGTPESQITYQFSDVTLTGGSGIFDGVKSRVSVRTMPASAFDRPLVMRITYREADDVRKPVALASTSRCGHGGLVLLSLERGGIKLEMSSYGRTPIIFRLPTAGFKKEDLKELLLYHDREHLTVIAASGKLTYMRRAKVAVLPYLQCGLDFGNSEWMDGFNGTITRVQLLRCDPADLNIF
ncbi:protein PIF-like [Babylonia areolata]|uniref:protein PIF-like n=1 Tax=Babylonia areolata TaxID=304850 RepID=UPI003FCF374C